MGKLLIINADDFGLDVDVNIGIVDAHRNGLVRSASFMVNVPAAESAAATARTTPELEVGLHVNVTEGRCLLPPAELWPLVDEDGTFCFDTANIPSAARRLRDQVEADAGLADRVAAEVMRQIERFRELGLTLAHINAHHYWPLIHPRLYARYVNAAEQAGVPFRGFCEPMLHLLDVSPVDVGEMARLTRTATVPSPSLSLSNPLDASGEQVRSPKRHRALIEETLAILASRPEIAAVELITHPAKTHTRETDVYAWARGFESALVHSTEFSLTIERLGYTVCGYSALSRTDY